jgi:hypothetical protein
VLFSHGPTKAYLVPGLCRETERNGNSISADEIVQQMLQPCRELAEDYRIGFVLFCFCVPNVVVVSGLSVLDCHFGVL